MGKKHLTADMQTGNKEVPAPEVDLLTVQDCALQYERDVNDDKNAAIAGVGPQSTKKHL